MSNINISALNNGSNIAEWMLIINDWSGGILFSAILFIIALIVFGIAKSAGTDDVKAFLGTSFAMFLISGVAWFVRWEGLVLVPTFTPLFFLFMAGLGALMVLIGDRVFNAN